MPPLAGDGVEIACVGEYKLITMDRRETQQAGLALLGLRGGGQQECCENQERPVTHARLVVKELPISKRQGEIITSDASRKVIPIHTNPKRKRGRQLLNYSRLLLVGVPPLGGFRPKTA